MSTKFRIRSNIQKIREYSRNDPDLWGKAHHFLYDKRYSESEIIRYIVMGINPGEPLFDPNLRTDDLLEETSESDFLKNGIKTSAAKKWQDRCVHVCGTSDIALTEAFFWSSRNVAELKKRWNRGKHANFCTQLNKELIEIHNPKAVIFTGIGHTKEIASEYELVEAGKPKLNDKGRRLIVPYKDKSDRPWIFVKHFSAWISNSELDSIGKYVRLIT